MLFRSDIDRMTGGEFDLGRERNVEEESSDRNLTKGMGVEDEHDNKNKIKNANRNEMIKESDEGSELRKHHLFLIIFLGKVIKESYKRVIRKGSIC